MNKTIIMGNNINRKKVFKQTDFKMTLPLSFLILIFMCGCITSQPSRFYVLTPFNYNTSQNKEDVSGQAETGLLRKIDISTKTALKKISLGLGPVKIAKYLDRSQLVVRLNPHQIRLEDFHQWAGSPRDDIPAILLENLSGTLGIDTIYAYPWRSYADIDYQILVDIIQLDGIPGNNVRLVARWEILGGNGQKSHNIGKADFMEPVTGNSFDLFAEAQSRALGKLSIIIAESLIKLL